MPAQYDMKASVVVIGPADLATTAIVAALEARAISVVRLAEPTPFAAAEGPDAIPDAVIALVDVSTRPEAMRQVAAALSVGWEVLVLSADGRSARVAAAVAAGAVGWMSTAAPLSALVAAVVEVGSGGSVMSCVEREAWVEQHRVERAEAERRARLLDRLTDREFTVLRFLDRGMRAADIAASSVVAITTVRTQIRSILQKLEVNSQEGAISMYRAALRAKTDSSPPA